MGRNMDELQEEYRTELLKFLIQKITHAGGSLQFQHLSGLFQQLRFEIKDTFGATKSALMKFLKANPNTFKVSTKGVVTVINSTLECPADEANQADILKKICVPKIENGEGYMFKIFPRYAIIQTSYPIHTYIFFTPPGYGAGKDSLFGDLDLNVGDKVGFNANHGHSDYEIEYRATKVWRIKEEEEEENVYPENKERNKIKKPNKLITGNSFIKKLFPNNVGFISGEGYINSGKDIFFDKKYFKDLDIKCGDKVKFVAQYISNEWQATEITKKKNINVSSDHPETCINKQSMKRADKHISEESIKNEPGRIFVHSKGAIIKFGKKFSEIADGSACNFYLFGIRVAYPELAMEFCEGDDITFDAVKSEDMHGWKAVLAWKGDKPATFPDKKSKENFGCTKSVNEIVHDEISSDHSSEVCKSRRRRNLNTKKDVNVLGRGESESSRNKANTNKDVNVLGRESESIRNKAMADCPPRRKFNSTSENYHKDNIASSKMMPQKLPHKGTKNTLDKRKKKCNKNANDKYNQRASFSKSKFDNVEKNSEKLLTSKDSYFDESPFSDLDDSSEVASEENNELQDSLHFPRKFLKVDNQQPKDTLDLKEESLSESEFENETPLSKESRIKTFKAIDGEVIKLYCKFGVIKSDLLIKDVEFILNAFYLNGKSVEEQQVTDLKEVIKVGDVVKLNCFEIIDDKGEIHQKVTVAWKGSKPNVCEMKPQEFILENDLNVSGEQDYEVEPAEGFDTGTFDEASELNLEAGLSLNDRLDDNIPQEYSGTSKNTLDGVDEHGSSNVGHHETLPDLVLRKLATCGLNSEDAFNVAQEIVELVLKNSGVNELSANESCSLKSDSATVCSACHKTKKSVIGKRTTTDAEVQTIVTGEVVATSIFTEHY